MITSTYVLHHHTNGHVHINMINSTPSIKIVNKYNFIPVYQFKSQTTSCGDIMFTLICILWQLFANTAAIKV